MLKLTLAFILLFAGAAKAQDATVQTGTVKGTVYALIDTTEKELFGGWKKEELPTANVLLINLSDSSAIAGDATDLNGQYIISGIEPDNYILKVSYVGLNTNKIDVSITADDTLIKNVQLTIPSRLHDHSIAKTNFLRINEEGVIIYQPVDDYLVEITQNWGSERSELGDLRTKQLNSTVVVLRFWDGYGLGGTRGIILKKIDGNWSALKLNVESCPIFYPDSLKEKVTEKEFFSRNFSTKDCNGDDHDFGRLTYIDTVLVSPFNSSQTELNQLWNNLLEAGLLDLPTHVEDNLIVMHGRHFVVEVRIGDLYRVSGLTYFKEPKVKAHERIKKLAKILYNSLHPYQ